MIEKLLSDRRLPELKSREEMLEILAREEYGVTPAAPKNVSSRTVGRDENPVAGKAVCERIEVTFEADFGTFTFPFDLTLPKADHPVPAFVYIDFSAEQPNKYFPQEEIVDGGFAAARLFYKDVVNDNYHGDFSDGLGLVYYQGRERKGDEWGKIGMWAYAASRVLDVLLTRPEIDPARVAVVGHSRLGKTALWCGAQDQRFSCVISNDSGCGGAAIFRNKIGEHVSDMEKNGLWDWFCQNYRSYANREEEMPFDQHFLLACVSPRRLVVASAALDDWADPDSEYLSCWAASPKWGKGIEAPDRLPKAGDDFLTGENAYHLRPGTHFLSRYDWQRYMKLV